jgi:Phosphopantothenoylcysteine synthetase/decarboxylase
LNIAQHCADKGLQCNFLFYGHGSLNIQDDSRMNIVRVKTTEEMLKVLRERISREKQHIVFHAAAVADFTVAHSGKNPPIKWILEKELQLLNLFQLQKLSTE